jgi:hypothetical protein
VFPRTFVHIVNHKHNRREETWRRNQWLSVRAKQNPRDNVLRHLTCLMDAGLSCPPVQLSNTCVCVLDVEIRSPSFKPFSEPHLTRFSVSGIAMCPEAYACFKGLDPKKFLALLKTVEETHPDQRGDLESDLNPPLGFAPIRKEPIIDRSLWTFCCSSFLFVIVDVHAKLWEEILCSKM